MLPLARATLAAALFVHLGCGEESKGAEGPRTDAARVELGEARTGALRVSRVYLGQVHSLARAELAAGASGAVITLHAREGDRVSEGDVLVEVDPRLARAELAAARASASATEAELEQARRDAERMERAGKRTVAGIEIEHAASRAEALTAGERNQRAVAARARAELSRHKVAAPFDGVVARRMIDTGDWVQPGDVVLELVADTALEVHVRAEPRLLEDLAVGHPATLLRGDREVPASVQAVVPALDPATRTVQVRLLPEARPPWLLAGDTVDVRLDLERSGQGVIVPRDALVHGAVEMRVVKADQGIARPITVEVLDYGVDEVRVSGEGISAGDSVVVRGNDRLREGQALEVLE